jgi:hypothetical protein
MCYVYSLYISYALLMQQDAQIQRSELYYFSHCCAIDTLHLYYLASNMFHYATSYFPF